MREKEKNSNSALSPCTASEKYQPLRQRARRTCCSGWSRAYLSDRKNNPTAAHWPNYKHKAVNPPAISSRKLQRASLIWTLSPQTNSGQTHTALKSHVLHCPRITARALFVILYMKHLVRQDSHWLSSAFTLAQDDHSDNASKAYPRKTAGTGAYR
jgi:hypothetical protein